MTIDRRVRSTGKDDGDIISLCNSGEWWSPRSKSMAISDIESGDYRYYVKEVGTREVEVKVKTRSGNKYLTTEADGNSDNNLDNLPDC